ncbi:protein of unknown function [Pseudomonas marincola]|uniref:Uncharacterized protein n=1 Tax=Pseudomonas marincola TaxID=437900 RepID=A0A8S2B7W7_9PSED|nr:protein of unknown function [Pseudomonas marincola]
MCAGSLLRSLPHLIRWLLACLKSDKESSAVIIRVNLCHSSIVPTARGLQSRVLIAAYKYSK